MDAGFDGIKELITSKHAGWEQTALQNDQKVRRAPPLRACGEKRGVFSIA